MQRIYKQFKKNPTDIFQNDYRIDYDESSVSSRSKFVSDDFSSTFKNFLKI